MNRSLRLLFATTALTVALCLPALAAGQYQGNDPGICGSSVCALLFGDGDRAMPLIRVSADAEEEDDEEDCDDEEDEACIGATGMGNPAPAGTVAPPANGLFGTGAPPVAVTR